MGKLLHERLRKYAEDGVGAGADSPVAQMLKEYQLTPRLGNVYGEAAFLRKLADEIERCYHPKPVDGDGKPWELGDACITAEGEGATIVGYRPGGRVFIDLHDEREFARCYASDLKRALKVLDADGVPCEVGDEVWDVRGGKPYKVLAVGLVEADSVCIRVTDRVSDPIWRDAGRFTHERPVFDADGERICKDDTVYLKRRLTPYVVVGFRDGLVVATSPLGERNLFPHSDLLTHREPDSLEKLQDLISAIDNVHGGSNTELHLQIDKAYDMCTALIERGA